MHYGDYTLKNRYHDFLSEYRFFVYKNPAMHNCTAGLTRTDEKFNRQYRSFGKVSGAGDFCHSSLQKKVL